MVDLLLVQSIYALGTIAAAGTGGLLWQYRERSGALSLVAMMGAMVIWNGSLFCLTLVDGFAIASVFFRTVFVGVAFVSVAKLLFVLEYTGREHLLRPAVLVPLSIPPVVTVFLAFANPWNLFFTTLEASKAGSNPLAFEFGVGALLPLVYGYGINVVLTVMILGFIYRSRAVYRGQSVALLGGVVATWIANGAYTFDLVSFDVTAVGSVASGMLFTVAILRYRLLDLMPIARDRVLENVNDAVFVVGTDDRLVDINPEGRRTLATIGVEPDGLIGRSFPSVIAGTDLHDRYETATTAHEETTDSVSLGDADFQVTVTPIDDSRERHVGWLLLAHDVTDRKRHEAELERQNERLERFASLVSHDLRNPLNVANGYLELAMETDENEAYLDEVEASYRRMETIIEDVLALAREGAADADPEPVDLGAVARAAWEGVDTGSASARIDAAVTVRGDPDRLRRALENLFRNAIDHASEHDDAADLEITVGTIGDAADGSFEGFYVADDGIGIPACRRDQVLDDGYTTSDSGTGLGLSIVGSIAAAHDWSVAVSESETGGARFEFTGVETAPVAETSTPAPASRSTTDSPSS